MNTSHYFLIEATNIGNNIYDTDHLSIIRGSSFLLKEAIEAIKDALHENIEAISTGASLGLFQVKPNAPSCDVIAKEMSDLLEAHDAYALFTFAIEYCEAESLLVAKEKLRTQLRFNQLKSLSIPTDSPNLKHSNSPCELDGRRAQAREHKERLLHGKHRLLSHSLHERLMVGREKRVDYYEKELENSDLEGYQQLNLHDYNFSEDLESLAKNPDYPKLNNKIAVIYIDGNQFSSIQKAFIESSRDDTKAQKDFDQIIQNKRKVFLLALLKGMIADEAGVFRLPDAYFINENYEDQKAKYTLRLETLLWGGDEMTLVVPAWLGFEVLQLFFEITAGWTLPIENKENKPLTHAAGMVFCSVKSPIRIMRNLAESIANTTKEESRDKNLWNYMILESIDYPHNNQFLDYWQKRYPAKLGLEKPKSLKPATNWPKQKQSLQQLIQPEGQESECTFPRGQLYHIAQAIQQDTADAVKEESITWDKLFEPLADNSFQSKQAQKEQRFLQLGDKKSRDLLKTQLPDIAKELFSLEDLDTAQNRKYFWLHLIETWDYLIPNKVATREGNS